MTDIKCHVKVNVDNPWPLSTVPLRLYWQDSEDRRLLLTSISPAHTIVNTSLSSFTPASFPHTHVLCHSTSNSSLRRCCCCCCYYWPGPHQPVSMWLPAGVHLWHRVAVTPTGARCKTHEDAGRNKREDSDCVWRVSILLQPSVFLCTSVHVCVSRLCLPWLTTLCLATKHSLCSHNPVPLWIRNTTAVLCVRVAVWACMCVDVSTR